ncbi:MAG: RNA methyltransferase [Candidatus Binataceae bacterium]
MKAEFADAVEQVAIVLFKPKSSGNIGAVARALKNMGLADLRLVAPTRFNRRAAAAMAVHADDVLDKARIYPSLAAALEDCTLTVGTTCRPGPYRSSAQTLREMAADLALESRVNKVAIIFGPEDCGLTNQELKLCHRLLTIPTAPDYRSINLAQSVMIVAYELMMAFGATDTGVALDDIASAGDGGAGENPNLPELISRAPAQAVEAMMERMAAALVAIGFVPADNPDHIMFAIRNILGRSGLSPRELDILNGLARQIGWFAEGGRETIAAKLRSGRKIR